MKFITRWTLAATAAERFRRQYTYRGVTAPGHLAKCEALDSLGAAPDPDVVDAVIDNTSWTAPGRCNECNSEVTALVEVGEQPEHSESATARVCVSCLEKALALAKGSS